jgi:uncharacterized protein (DUF1330 family)
MAHLTPTEEQIQAFSEHPHEGPIWMWNLLRFKDGEAGRASYARYVETVGPMVAKRGGRMLLRARGQCTLIGPDHWDEALVIEYPSRHAFIDMVTSAEYEAIVHFRHDALEDSRLYMTTEISGS